MTWRRGGELAALISGLGVWSYLGWDSALWSPAAETALHLLAVAAVGWLVVHVARGGALPHTRFFVPLLALVGAYGLASLSAWNPGLSARALASLIVTVAMLPIALLALRHRPRLTALVVVVPTLALAVEALVAFLGRRIEWVVVGAPGIPPVRLANEATPFGHVTVPPFVLLATLPLVLLVEPRWLRRALLGALLAVGVPLTLLSGSRSAWIAMAVAAAIMIGPRLQGVRRPRRLSWRWIAAALVIAVGALGALAFIAPRLTSVRSLISRTFLWRDTLLAMRDDPLFGIGPGSMPWARQAASPPLSLPVQQPHSHNIPLGLLGDAGVIGLIAGATLLVAFVVLAGPWRTRSLVGGLAFAILMGLAVSGLTDDLTYLPNFNLLVILLAALALADAGAIDWRPVRLAASGRWIAAGATGLAALALATVMVLGDAAALAYGFGVDASAAGDWTAARIWLERSVRLDPWHPAGPKALAIAAEHDGRSRQALSAARVAVDRSPGDGEAWTNLALLCLADGERACAHRAADEALARTTLRGREAANAALVYQALEDDDLADRAYAVSLIVTRTTGLALEWPRQVDVEAAVAALAEPPDDLTLVIARRVTGQAVDPAAYEAALPAALAHAMLGQREASEEAWRRAANSAPGGADTWAIGALLAARWGNDPGRWAAVYQVVAGEPLPLNSARPRQREPRPRADISAFRSYPSRGLVSVAERLRLDPPWPWALLPLLSPPAAGAG